MDDLPALDWYSPTLRAARDLEYALLMYPEFTVPEADHLARRMTTELLGSALHVMVSIGTVKPTYEYKDGLTVYRRIATRFAALTMVCKPRNRDGDFIDLSWRSAEYALLNFWRIPIWFTESDLRAPETLDLRHRALRCLFDVKLVIRDGSGRYKFDFRG